MGLIRNDADRKADARIEDDKQDWYVAHKIAALKTKEQRVEALEKLLVETDRDYYLLIRTRSASIYARHRANAAALADQASENYQKTFGKSSTVLPVKTSSGRHVGVTGTTHRASTHKSTAAKAVADLLSCLSDGVSK